MQKKKKNTLKTNISRGKTCFPSVKQRGKYVMIKLLLLTELWRDFLKFTLNVFILN